MNYREIVLLIESAGVKDFLFEGDSKILSVFGQDFAMMQGYSQNNPHHCYSLLEHTLQTLLALDCDGLSDSEKLELQIAALYHDVGKPKVAFEKNGKTVFYNHAKTSKEIVEKELRSSGVDEHTIYKIGFFVEYHDMFISFKLSNEIQAPNNPYIKKINVPNVKEEIKKVINDQEKKGEFVPSYHDFAVLLRLCCADASAQSEKVIENGQEIDSKERKLKRLKEISRIIEKL